MRLELVLEEVGRLHLENLELSTENARLRAALAERAGPPSVGLEAPEPTLDEPPADPS